MIKVAIGQIPVQSCSRLTIETIEEIRSRFSTCPYWWL